MLEVSKYNASGNDFVIFHDSTKKDRSELANKLCHRQNGVGADGLIVILPHKTHDFEWQFYNSDGSTAAMCGNGTRACAHYAYNNNLAPKDMSFLTSSGIIKASVDKDIVETKFTKPIILQENIREFDMDFILIDTGVPHLVTFTKNDFFDKEKAFVLREKYNANVNFARLQDDKLYVRTYERGVEDETGACGTGMAACFFQGILKKDISENITVYPTSKEELFFRINDNDIYFKGAVKHTFDAKYFV
ncbi:MAG: Diaminopimelate epimerase (EC [uncultured Campylobacterales bacterium]|uniref:Diaminopimelate epimerase n=1 Tax=uncultured Campylobacterales bacterium TaxID=352960 RepID=A0A6S6SMG9_9BACT|nr:MAG: Diaminopimelate epimerase (EC [uncultured Campylobacterales bacterium]